MEWVETTAKTVEAAKNIALDQLGVAADEAEFEVVDEPRAGLFGRTRGEARVRARVKPTPVRPKQERRRRGGRKKAGQGSGTAASNDAAPTSEHDADHDHDADESRRDGEQQAPPSEPSAPSDGDEGGKRDDRGGRRSRQQSNQREKEPSMSNEYDDDAPEVSPEEVGEAAVSFMEGLVEAFGAEGTVELSVEGTELDVRVQGEGLGLLVGRGGRTLSAVQDLARVAAQRRLGDHETRLRIDVARYRERRAEALVKFAADVAAQVRDSGTARSLEPMSSADRKVIHDALNEEDGVTSRSEGEDPSRRVVVEPA